MVWGPTGVSEYFAGGDVKKFALTHNKGYCYIVIDPASSSYLCHKCATYVCMNMNKNAVISWALVGLLKWQRLGKPCIESSYLKHNVIFYPFFYCPCFLNLNKANHCLTSLSAALCSTMRALSTKTTGMETGCTAGPQAISSLASSTSTERKDTDNSCSLTDPPFRLTGWMDGWMTG